MMLQYGLNTDTAAKMFQKSMGGKQVQSGYLNNEILEKIGFDDVSRVGILSVFEDMKRDDEQYDASNYSLMSSYDGGEPADDSKDNSSDYGDQDEKDDVNDDVKDDQAENGKDSTDDDDNGLLIMLGLSTN